MCFFSRFGELCGRMQNAVAKLDPHLTYDMSNRRASTEPEARMRAPDDRQADERRTAESQAVDRRMRAEGDPLPARDRLHTGVSATIESRILSGSLKVGDKLQSEGALRREFGVSTRSIREAIQVLETKGLVQRRHGERTTVVCEDVTGYLGTLAVTVRQKFRDDPDYLLHLMAVRRMSRPRWSRC